jgi:GTPase
MTEAPTELAGRAAGTAGSHRPAPTGAARPVVVVAGRPNVGKSSLVNRIVGRRAAVVEEEPGVTRDRKVLEAEWAGVPFQLVDTGGWTPGRVGLDAQVRRQAEQALDQADLIVFVVDVTTGVTAEDLAAARVVRRASAPVVLAANKVDDHTWEAAAWDFVRLGLGDPWPVSAAHGRGTGDLLDEVVRQALRSDEGAAGTLVQEEGPTDGSGREIVSTASPASTEPVETAHTAGTEQAGVPQVALVGRPNAGKSTLFNRIIGEERSIVHDMPGTTRDVIDTELQTDDGPLKFLDTAGMRRPSRTGAGTEQHSVLRALEALDRADIAVLVIDATVGPSHQDQRLAERMTAAGCPAIVVLNKWEVLDAEQRQDVLASLDDRLKFLGDAPVLRISARSGKGVHRLFPAIWSTLDSYRVRVPTGMLNRALRDLQAAHPAHGARIRYGVQGASEPPTFTLFASGRLQPSYLRYLERGLRERFELGSTPIKIRVRIMGRRA